MKSGIKTQLALKYFTMYLMQWATLRTGIIHAKPSHVFISNSPSCNLRCQMCDNWHLLKDEQGYIAKAKLFTVLQEIRSWLGSVKITFCGPGETFSNPDIIDCIRFASDIGLHIVVTTNGTLLDETLAKQLIDANILQANISIDGTLSHDYLRGIEGTFDKAISGIKRLCHIRDEQNSSAEIMINCTVTGQNLEELVELESWAQANQVRIRFNPLDHIPRDSVNATLWVKDFQKLDQVMNQLHEKRKRSEHILNYGSDFEDMKTYFRNPGEFHRMHSSELCLGCIESLFINYDGGVSTCVPIGNLHDTSIKEMWNTKETKQLIQQQKRCGTNCVDRARAKGNLVNRMKIFLRAT